MLAFAIGLITLPTNSPFAKEPNLPRLILQITVDSLRGDMPMRSYNRLGRGGLRYLLDAGTVYSNAHHRHANIVNEGLGGDAIPDYLSISFSSTDYIGHMFGASSLESEDNILQLDRSLAELFRFVDAKVGLDKTLIVLSADHGGPETPGYLNELGFEADYIDPKLFDRVGALNKLKKRFGIGEQLIATYFHPYVYLNRKLIAEKGLDQAEVELAVAAELTRFDGVALAVSSSALSAGKVADTPLTQSILRNYNSNRSGDIYVVFKANRFINDFDGLTVAASHGGMIPMYPSSLPVWEYLRNV